MRFELMMARFCQFSLLVVILLVLATGYVSGITQSFQINSGSPSAQPSVIPEGNQYKDIGSSFYIRPGRNASIELTYTKTGSSATEESVRWLFNNVEINFAGGSVETIIENGKTFLKQYSVNYPDIYLIRDTNVSQSMVLVVSNVSKAKSEGTYTAEILQDNIVLTSATSELRVVPPDPVTPGPDCVQAAVDVCFVIDGSGSLSQTGYDEERDFVVNIVNQLTSNSNRYCYAIFDSNIRSSFALTSDRAEFSRSLLAESYPSGGTNLLVALSHANTDLLTNGNRIDDRRRIMFFLTDGQDDSGVESLRGISTSLASKGVETIAIGFGNDVNIDINQLMAIGLNDSFVFLNFQEATETIGNITSVICEDTKPCCTGPAGYRGKIGAKGYSGTYGDDGVPGTCVTLEECFGFGSSQTGSPGTDGDKGDTGPKGLTGEAGAVGLRGDKGRSGVTGDDGVKGGEGNKGLTGNNGVPGSDGRKGDEGDAGIDGDRGQTGVKGFKGQPGIQGVCTTASCEGDQGDKGENGQKGQKGPKGSQNQQGQKGFDGDKGTTGVNGDNGGTGAKGSPGITGDAIEKKDLVNQACSPSGKLYLDPATKKLYYCENGRYMCISSNDTCEGEKPCFCPSSNTNCGQFTRNAMSQACGNNVAVDFILVVDDTSSMDRQQTWLRSNLPDLEEALKKLCIGNSTEFPNLYQIVAYGGDPNFGPGTFDGCNYGNGEAPHFVIGCDGLCCQFALPPPTNNPVFPISGLEGATGNLQNIGGFSLTGDAEVAYAALEYALDNAVLRTTTRDATFIPAIILLTNGDADDYSDARFDSLLNRFVTERPSTVLAFALNLGDFQASNILQTPFGVANNYEDGNLTAWLLPSDSGPATSAPVPYGEVTCDVSPSVTPNSEFRNVDRDLIDLLMCSKRSSASFWDLDYVVRGGAEEVTRFTNAFIQQNSDAIINRAQQFNCRLCFCTSSGSEVCVLVENERICNCLQDNPSTDCSCINARLQEIAQQGVSLTLTSAEADTILSDCGLTQTTPPPSSVNCRDYVQCVNGNTGN